MYPAVVAVSVPTVLLAQESMYSLTTGSAQLCFHKALRE